MSRRARPSLPSPDQELKATYVLRAGITAHYWSDERGPGGTQVGAIPPASLISRGWGGAGRLPDGCVIIETEVRSKGSGTTKVRLEIGAKDFPPLLAAMSKANRYETMTAMAKELLAQIEAGRPDAS